MGRKPSKNMNLPAHMRARNRRGKVWYYYDTGGKPRKEIPLGSDYILAIQQWAKLNMSPAPVLPTVGFAISKYKVNPEFLALAKGTQADYGFALDKLMEFFHDAPLDQVTAIHVRKYHTLRRQDNERWKGSLHRANREVRILGMIFRYARGEGWTTNDPTEPIKIKKLPGRGNIVITDDMLDAVYQNGSIALQDAMDLAYYIGQRPGDLLTLSVINKRDGRLEYRQSKTGTAQRIEIDAEFGAFLQRVELRKAQCPAHSIYLLVDERGEKMTKAKLRSRFEAARDAAGIDGKAFQFRDLRRKAGSDLREQKGLQAAQDLLGHKEQSQTEHYTGARGDIVIYTPKRKR